MNKCTLLMLLVLQTSVALTGSATSSFPGQHWQQYSNPEDAGFSTARLDSARTFFENSGAAGLFVVHRGRVLAAWGETNRRFICASVRKSFMNALIGVAVDLGQIDLNKTLADLKIDDIQALTETEKQATVKHLLAARSGVYHPAAYSPQSMEENLPVRGSHAPGEFWYYNNWDFNVLATILKQETGLETFDAFKEQIAIPLQMEDFRLEDTYYRYEPEKSKHPAYLFRLSARDMARFGLLYLNNGNWGGGQIVPAGWVEESTRPVTKVTRRHANLGQYGYLWWISHDIRGQKMYFASGSGGQRILVFPEAELVVVHVVDTYQNKSVSHEQIIKLLGLLLDARVAVPGRKPSLSAFQQARRQPPKTMLIRQEQLSEYTGTFHHRFLGEFIVRSEGGQLVMETGIGIFKLLPIGEDQFWPPDIEIPILFKRAETKETKSSIASILDSNRNVTQVVFYY